MTTVKVTALVASATFVLATPTASQAPVPSPHVVEVDGRDVRVLTVGLGDRAIGEPVFILQSGNGAPLDTWHSSLVRTIAELAPVVAYDRPGLGRSQFYGPDPSPQRVAAHLTSLLDVLDVGPPYILVGHSWGGPLILYFAAQHPEDVSGLVYIDPSVPSRDQFPADPTERAAAVAQIEAARASYLRGRGPGYRAAFDYWLTPPDARAIPPNPNVPTAAVLGTLVTGPVSERAEMEALQERRVEEARTWLQGVDRLHFVVAPHVGHFVHRDDPDLVVEAIRQVFDWTQGRP
jgi:pimeloyl-ACP methyl ester carboxylesterase